MPVLTDPSRGRKDGRSKRASSESVALGRLLATYRVDRGLTQTHLCERTGIAPSALSRIECGNIEIGIKTLRRYLRGLGMTLEFRDLSDGSQR